ncbi:glycosyltransferase family 4 protein [Marinobacterium arenosum]|uniref:glycosyltransferase family 4 protein n=1 Tax=Marinobacterium arenosum TaxID=2862496 RepID=UPI001C95F042|nr:glycosyltransferase family 4 protein [Marinobacterium arenosum]MBY4676441.1 glycosyltransferase family 4 protein [Marinobacterium arenosum]
MKVIQILPDLDGGGVERGTLEVAKALVEAGHQSLVISAGGRMVAELERDGSQHIQWDLGRKSLWTLRHVRPLRCWLRQQRPDILHVRSRLPGWIVYLAWKGLPANDRPRLVTTVHGLYSVSRYSAIMCKGERVIAVSDTVRRYIADNYPTTDMTRVRVVYRGIEPDAFPRDYRPSDEWLAQWRQQYPQLAGKQVITLPGRLTRLKGHHDLIELIDALVKQGQPVHGLIVGGEDAKRKAYAEELYRTVQQRGLAEHITFTGNRSDIRDIYAVSDLVLSLSTKPESFGRTSLEALSLGVPLAGYDHGGVGEILAALFPAGRVPLKDAAALQRVVTDLLQHPQQPQPNDRFLLDDMLANTLAIYRELLS